MGCRLSQNALFHQTCSKEHVFTKYQWNNDGFYSSKTVIFGNIDEQSVFTKRRLFVGAQQQDERFVNIDVRWLANIDYTARMYMVDVIILWSMFGKHSHATLWSSSIDYNIERDRCVVNIDFNKQKGSMFSIIYYRRLLNICEHVVDVHRSCSLNIDPVDIIVDVC